MNIQFFEKMKDICDETVESISSFFKDKAVEAHVFGSIARGTNDALSDIDIWFTFEDSDIKKLQRDSNLPIQDLDMPKSVSSDFLKTPGRPPEEINQELLSYLMWYRTGKLVATPTESIRTIAKMFNTSRYQVTKHEQMAQTLIKQLLSYGGIKL